MPELLKAIILGLIEGLTEFLPISSTGHLIVASALLNFLPHLRDTFDIFIQLGAVVAVVAFYFPEIVRQFRSVPTNRVTQRFWVSILIAFIPAAVVAGRRCKPSSPARSPWPPSTTGSPPSVA